MRTDRSSEASSRTERQAPRGLSVHQQRAALRMLEEVARGERTFVGFRVTKEGTLHECATDTFVERTPAEKGVGKKS